MVNLDDIGYLFFALASAGTVGSFALYWILAKKLSLSSKISGSLAVFTPPLVTLTLIILLDEQMQDDIRQGYYWGSLMVGTIFLIAYMSAFSLLGWLVGRKIL